MPNLVRRGILVRADAKPGQDDQPNSERADPLELEGLQLEVLGHRRAKLRELRRKARQLLELLSFLLGAKVRVIEVLAPACRVDAGGLELGRRPRRDPDVVPGRRDAERLDPLDLGRVGDPGSARVEIAETAA
jgi:hypothetical protein